MPVLPAGHLIAADVARALAEDIGEGDLTAELIPADQRAQAQVVTREAAVLAGQAWFEACFAQIAPEVRIRWFARDGERVSAGQALCELEGPARALLSGERSALNFLQTLSGTATSTAAFVAAVDGTGCRILDTRKTLPGLRLAQKYAVRCGGALNHRIGLFDAILIKENHILACGGIAAAVTRARRCTRPVMVEVEVENFDELEQACLAGADRIMLDEFALDELARAVAVCAGRAELEVSGGVGLEQLPLIARTGVDFISIGALTKHLRAVDLSMRLQ